VSFNVAMLKQMQAEGLDFDAAIRVLEAGERRSDPTAVDRQRKCRAKKANGHAVTVTRDSPPNDRDILTPQAPPNGISSEIPPPADKIELKPEHVVEVWNDLATRHGLSAVKKITPERRKKLQTFIRRHTIDDITEAIAAIPRSPFLLGENQRGWQASFDWFLEPRNLTKLTEGTYVH
jgi:hypothetical protein